MSRPTKYTFGRIKRILKALRKGHSKAGACGSAGIDFSTMSRWENDYARFASAIKRAQEYALAAMEQRLRNRLPDSDTLLIFWMKTQGGYRDRVAVEHSGEMTVKHERTQREIEAERELSRLAPEGRRAVLDAFRGSYRN